jgi:hypothetical protein
LAPVFAVAVVLGAVIGLVKMGWVSDETAFWLWPTLFAVLFLALAVWAFLTGARIWLWPLGTAFVVQTVGLILLLVLEVFESRWTPLWYSLGAVAAVLLIMLGVQVVSTIRARMLERQIAEGSGGGEQDLERIREDMKEALELLRRAGRGRNAIYELPWFLVMGRPAAGKTVAIKNSELGLPVKRDWVKGVGGTYTCDWFFTNELIFLDTPGKWVTEGADDEGREHWRELVRLLRKNRGRQPLDGLIVVVPADDLLSLSDDELEDQATNIREVVDLIHDELSFRFPIYLLVSKCDLVEGFVDFFKGLPSQRRHEILGWSNDDPNRSDAARLVREGFNRVQRRLQTYRLEMLGKIAKRTQARRLFFFTEEFKGLEGPLATFADAFFLSDRFSEAPVFRGFYFTSGTQEGAPLSKAMADLSRALGVPASKTQEVEQEESKRSYFLLDLFRELMVGDEGLVGRTAGHWWRLRRNTFLGAFAPAGIAILFLVLALVALGLNKRTYSNLKTDSGQITGELAEMLRGSGGYLKTDELEAALERTGKLRSYHVQMAGFQPFRMWGMRRPGELAPDTFELYREQFGRAILDPTLAEASRRAMDANRACIDRISLLRSVVWLRTGRRAGFDNLAGLDPVWGVDAPERADQAKRIRDEFRRQYVYLKSNISEEESNELLQNFSVRKVAKGIADDCGQQGATSMLAQYGKWQNECGDPVTDTEVLCCYQDLVKVLGTGQEDYARLTKDFESLKSDLMELRGEVPEAKYALETLEGVDLAQAQTGECLTRFEKNIASKIKTYALKDDMLEQCREEVNKVGRGERWTVRDAVLSTQATALAEEEKTLAEAMKEYSFYCEEQVPGFVRPDIDSLRIATTSFRRVACFDISLSEGQCDGDAPPPPPTRAARRPTRRPATPSPTAPTRPRPTPPPVAAGSDYAWFAQPAKVRSKYTPANWESLNANNWSLRWLAIQERKGFTESQAALKERELKGEISGYASRYVSAWMGYLESLRLQERKAAVPAWIDELASTKEFGSLIGTAIEAAGIAETMTEPPLDVAASKMEPLEGLAELKLAEYQAALKRIARDLKDCEESASKWQAYRAAVNSRDDGNSLVAAREWVTRNAGPALAGGNLTSLLNAPLDEAQAYVLSDNLLRAQWKDLRRLYADEIAGRAPLAGSLDDDVVSLKSLQGLLGGATGAVIRVRKAAEGEDLNPAAAAWLDRAEALSALFFKPGTDELQPVRLTVAIDEEGYDPEKFGKEFRLEAVTVHLGEGATFDWEQDDTRTRTLKVALFGEEASEFAFVEGTIAERKGPMGRMFGKKWKEGEGVEAAKAEGRLAPLRLITTGISAEEPNTLNYSLEVPWKKDKSGFVRLKIGLSGSDVKPLLELMQTGLAPPPETIKEN